MKKKISFPGYFKIVLILLFVSLFIELKAQTATAPFFGDGTSENPYLITSLENLYWITSDKSNWDKHYVQISNIDASETAIWFSHSGWIPIGYTSTGKFTGSYNGLGHTIINLFINRPSADEVGLFGNCSGAVIENLGVTNINIVGNWYVGGLAGAIQNYSTICNCFTSGTVSGRVNVGGLIGYSFSHSIVSNCYSAVISSGENIGGLVGSQYSSTISNCYAIGNIIGSYMAGGLTGGNFSSTINNCYSTGNVSGTSYIGGLVGFSDGTISNSFWDTTTSGQSSSAGGIGKTTAEMKTPSIFGNAGWSYYDWYIGDGINSGYPYLSWQNSTGTPIPPKATAPSAGDGTIGNPYQIATLENLYWIASNTSMGWYNKYCIQTTDINASETANWFKGKGWMPIGNSSSIFIGNYNGKGHLIDSLFINRPTTDDVGLFGAQAYTIDSLGITNANITGHDNVGVLVGYKTASNSSVNNCFSSGNVTGNNNVGGLIGNNFMTTMSNCYSFARVIGNYYVGGLLGNNAGSVVNKCFSSGIITGYYALGGLIGYNTNSTIDICYSTKSVDGRTSVGGLVGYNYYNSSISNCYSTGSVNSYSYVGGLLGRNENNCSVNNCYSTGRVSGTNWVGGLAASNISSTVTNCFWDTLTSGRSPSEGGTGKNTLEMKTSSTFTNTGWDFIDETGNGTEDIWGIGININNGYPYLSWQPSITNVYSIFENVVPDGLSTCINAFDTIMVAGGETEVEFQSGSSVDLIAGKSIRFLPGFSADYGSIMLAQITTDSNFCNGVMGSSVMDQTALKSTIEKPSPEKQTVVPGIKSIKVYPNPNNGQFTLELINVGNVASVCIYNMLGARVYQSTATNEANHKINLSGIRKGIYFLKVMDGKEQFTRKMVVD
jgi:hypothetical protein